MVDLYKNLVSFTFQDRTNLNFYRGQKHPKCWGAYAATNEYTL